jgi:predicted transcriptional regulator
MKSILIQVDDRIAKGLDRVAPAAKRQRAEFIRRALLRAIVEAEEQRTRQAYMRKPDSEDEADNWSNAEAFEA